MSPLGSSCATPSLSRREREKLEAALRAATP
jgi:hypothetical protein